MSDFAKACALADVVADWFLHSQGVELTTEELGKLVAVLNEALQSKGTKPEGQR